MVEIGTFESIDRSDARAASADRAGDPTSPEGFVAAGRQTSDIGFQPAYCGGSVEPEAGVLVEPERAHVAGNPDDGVRILGKAAHQQRASEWIVVGEVLLRQRRADDRHRRSRLHRLGRQRPEGASAMVTSERTGIRFTRRDFELRDGVPL